MAAPSREEIRSLGRRRPIHVGTRSFTANSEDIKCLAAMPVFAGEYVERVAIEAMSVARDDGENLDQPPIFVSYMTYAPLMINFMDLTPGAVDDVLVESVGFTGSETEYLGGEPNPGGNPVINFAPFSGRRLLTRMTFGDPIPTGRDALNNAEGRYYDHFKTVVKNGFEVTASGLLLFGVRSPRLDAQTDFGVAEMDNTSNQLDTYQAYNETNQSSLSAQEAKISELIHSGDNYIEADSFKEISRRCYVIARPQIVRSSRMVNTRA